MSFNKLWAYTEIDVGLVWYGVRVRSKYDHSEIAGAFEGPLTVFHTTTTLDIGSSVHRQGRRVMLRYVARNDALTRGTAVLYADSPFCFDMMLMFSTK